MSRPGPIVSGPITVQRCVLSIKLPTGQRCDGVGQISDHDNLVAHVVAERVEQRALQVDRVRRRRRRRGSDPRLTATAVSELPAGSVGTALRLKGKEEANVPVRMGEDQAAVMQGAVVAGSAAPCCPG